MSWLTGTMGKGEYCHADNKGRGIPNLIHASGDPAEAKEEIAHWFAAPEIFEYKALHEKFTR